MSYPELTPQMAIEAAGALLKKRWPKVDFSISVDGRPAYQIMHIAWVDGPTEAQVCGLILFSGLVKRDGDPIHRVEHFSEYMRTHIERAELTRSISDAHTTTANKLSEDAEELSANAAAHLNKYAKTGRDPDFAIKLLKWADSYQQRIDDKMRPRPTHTHRMASMAANAASVAVQLQRYQTVMRNLAALYDRGEVVRALTPIRQKWLLERLIDFENMPSPQGWGWDNYIKIVDNGILNADQYKDAHQLLRSMSHSQQQQETEKARDLALKLAQNANANIEGFFPTPKPLIDQILADIDPAWLGDGRILEPSAGDGDMAIALVDRFPNNDLDVVELNGRLAQTLRERLNYEGVVVIRQSFESFHQHIHYHNPNGRYRLIVANPPFENGMDGEHLRLMYDLLEPGGRIYCVVSTGPFTRGDRKSKEFREWYGQLPHRRTFIEEGEHFTRDQQARRTTSVKAKVVLIEKPKGESQMDEFKKLTKAEWEAFEGNETTALYAKIKTSPAALVAAFGQPTTTGDDPVTMEWIFTDRRGSVYTIYDYNSGAEGDLTRTKPMDFSIGMTDDGDLRAFLKMVDECLPVDEQPEQPQPEQQQAEQPKDGEPFTQEDTINMQNATPTGSVIAAVWKKLIATFGEPKESSDKPFIGWTFRNAQGRLFTLGATSYTIRNPQTHTAKRNFSVWAERGYSREELSEILQWLVNRYVEANVRWDSYGVIQDKEGINHPQYFIDRCTTVSIVPYDIYQAIGSPVLTPPEHNMEWWFEDRVSGWQYGISDTSNQARGEPRQGFAVQFNVFGGVDEGDHNGELMLFVAWLARAFDAELVTDEDDTESARPEETANESQTRELPDAYIQDSLRHWMENEDELYIYKVDGKWEIYGPFVTEIEARRAPISFSRGKHRMYDEKGNPIEVFFMQFSDTQLDKAMPYLAAWFSKVHRIGENNSHTQCASCDKPFTKGEQRMRSYIDGSVICQQCYGNLDGQQAEEMPDGLQDWIRAKNNDHTPLYLVAQEDTIRTFNVDAETLNRLLNGRLEMHDGGTLSSNYPVRYVEFQDTWLLAYTKYMQVNRVPYAVIANNGVIDSYEPDPESGTLSDAHELVMKAVRSLPPDVMATAHNLSDQISGSKEDIQRLLDELVERGLLQKNKFNQYERRAT